MSYLSETVAEIVRRLAERHPTGPLFLNVNGNPWEALAIVCRFQRLLVKLSGAEVDLPRLPRFDRRNFKGPTEGAPRQAGQPTEEAGEVGP